MEEFEVYFKELNKDFSKIVVKYSDLFYKQDTDLIFKIEEEMQKLKSRIKTLIDRKG